MKKRFNIKKIIALSFVYLVLFVMYVPILILIVYSFTAAQHMGQWTGFSIDLYIRMFYESEIMSALGNTLLIALASAILATLIGTISAIGIFYLRKIPKAIALNVNQITVINADVVTGAAFMLLFMQIKIIPDGYATLIIAHTIIAVPFVILAVLPRLGQLNANVYEAGLDVGAGPMRTLFTIIMPQLIPSMISGFALAFTLSLDDFVVTLFNKGDIDTISTYIYSKFTKGGLHPLLRPLSALILILSLLILIIINVNAKRKSKKAKQM